MGNIRPICIIAAETTLLLKLQSPKDISIFTAFKLNIYHQLYDKNIKRNQTQYV